MKHLGALVGAAVLGITGAVIATPAHAVDYDWTFVCNSQYSDAAIRVYSNYGSGYSYTVNRGGCTDIIFNGVDNLRVDVEAGSFLSDIDSYKIGEIGVGWGPCHENSENSASNPPDSYNWNGIRYRNYGGGSC